MRPVKRAVDLRDREARRVPLKPRSCRGEQLRKVAGDAPGRRPDEYRHRHATHLRNDAILSRNVGQPDHIVVDAISQKLALGPNNHMPDVAIALLVAGRIPKKRPWLAFR
jgi:hypothetical protein